MKNLDSASEDYVPNKPKIKSIEKIDPDKNKILAMIASKTREIKVIIYLHK